MKNTIKNKLFLGVGAGLAMVLLSGCFGSSGSSSGGGAVTTVPDSKILTEQATRFLRDNPDAVHADARAAATAEAQYGSAHQSSDTDATFKVTVIIDENGEVGFDTVWDGDGDGSQNPSPYSYRLGGSELSQYSGYRFEAYDYDDCVAGESGECYVLRERYFDEDVENGVTTTVGTDWYLDINVLVPEGNSLAAITTQSQLANVNWLVGGVWMFARDDGNAAGYDIGAFSSGADPYDDSETERNALEGQATYSGVARGIYFDYDDERAPTFNARVTLLANFDDSAFGDYPAESISGVVSDFDIAIGGSGNFRLTLGTAGLDGSGEEVGFFTGSTESGSDSASWGGSWSGNFYGNPDTAGSDTYPEQVGGTFGACYQGDGTVCDSAGDSMIGSFGANKQDE